MLIPTVQRALLFEILQLLNRTLPRRAAAINPGLLWERLWESFKSRREFTGPKQFVRVSTPLGSEEAATVDQRLESFLQEWLVPTDYEADKAHWKSTFLTAK